MNIADLLKEERITFATASGIAGVAPTSVWRWAKTGVDGVRLEHYRSGRKKYTTREALLRFLEKTTAIGSGEKPRPAVNGSRHTAAKKRLQKTGVLAAGSN